MATYPLWAAIRTVRDRIGTWVGYERFTAQVPGLSREDWARAIGEARAALANRVGELTRPLNRRPTAGEITAYTSRAARGFMQYVDVFVRDRETGLVTTRPFAIRSDVLRSRGAIVTAALSRYEAATLPEGTFEGEIIVGAAYAGTVEFIPRTEGE
jgi:hypothetical protein